ARLRDRKNPKCTGRMGAAYGTCIERTCDPATNSTSAARPRCRVCAASVQRGLSWVESRAEVRDVVYHFASCIQFFRSLPPHPSPLAWGEGATYAAPGTITDASNPRATDERSPSPQARGLG